MRHIRIFFYRFACAVVCGVVGSQNARACDLCGLYSAIQLENPISGSVRVGALEQYTYLDRVQMDGRHVANTEHQFLASSVTQVSGQYDLSDSFAMQAILPVLDRQYRRIEDGEAVRGSEQGIGDASLLFHFIPFRYANKGLIARLRVFAGLELPTGSAHRLGEEASHGSEEEETHHEMSLKHNGEDHGGGVESAIHGHDLALGSGSIDVPLGLGFLSQWNKFILAIDTQYNLRTEGSYSYQYANDLIWSSAVGHYLYLDDDSQVALRARLSGQYKEKDKGKGGVEYNDTAANSVFVGPELTAIINQRLQAVVGWDIPLDVNNSDLQITTTNRVRGGLTYRF